MSTLGGKRVLLGLLKFLQSGSVVPPVELALLQLTQLPVQPVAFGGVALLKLLQGLLLELPKFPQPKSMARKPR